MQSMKLWRAQNCRDPPGTIDKKKPRIRCNGTGTVRDTGASYSLRAPYTPQYT